MNPADHLLRIADQTITLDDLCDGDLFSLDPNLPAGEAFDLLADRGFDVAPVFGTKLERYVRKSDLEGMSSAVSELARPISAEDLVTAGLPLADAIELLTNRDWVFVMKRQGVYDIFTRADLQQPIVSVVLLGLIVTIEAALSYLIPEVSGPGWFGELTEERKAAVTQVLDDRRRTNTETSLMDCLYLSDKINLARKLGPIREIVGAKSGREFGDLGSKIIGLRNPLAHGGTILHATPDPQEAIKRFSLVRETATSLWAHLDAFGA